MSYGRHSSLLLAAALGTALMGSSSALPSINAHVDPARKATRK